MKKQFIQTKLSFTQHKCKAESLVEGETKSNTLSLTFVKQSELKRSRSASSTLSIPGVKQRMLQEPMEQETSVADEQFFSATAAELYTAPVEDEQHWILWNYKGNSPYQIRKYLSDKDCIALPCRNSIRWLRIESLLSNSKDHTFISLPNLIADIIENSIESLDLRGLTDFVHSNEESYTKELLSHIIRLALLLPTLFPQGVIPFLKKNHDQALTLGELQDQAASLLANALLCTFPESSYHFNFIHLYQKTSNTTGHRSSQRLQQKLKCLFNYFERISSAEQSNGTLTFHRHILEGELSEMEEIQFLQGLEVLVDGKMEDHCRHLSQIDFANKHIGGGVLQFGCVQEEILFLLCPALICSLLFTETLGACECLKIKGAQRFSTYTGYASTFQYDGPYVDDLPRDVSGRLEREIVAIDALPFANGNRMRQYSDSAVRRELRKAWIGFQPSKYTSLEKEEGIATGNWGCGAFGGHVQIKALIQIMAAQIARRDVRYFTFNDPGFYSSPFMEDMIEEHPLMAMYHLLQSKSLKVQDVLELISLYDTDIVSHTPTHEPSALLDLFSFIRMQIEDN